jgi:hypothetical protein
MTHVDTNVKVIERLMILIAYVVVNPTTIRTRPRRPLHAQLIKPDRADKTLHVRFPLADHEFSVHGF